MAGFAFNLPKTGQNNLWYEHNDSETVVVFVHGIFSDSRGCWLREDKQYPEKSVYWPALLQSDARFGKPSIYLAGFYTNPDSGQYTLRNCADEVLGALDRPDPDGRQGPLAKPTIVFICHSLGGIVARYLLEANQPRFVAKKVGLVLLASPSTGSQWANRLSSLSVLYNQQLGRQLEWKNWILEDLDARFKNVVAAHKLPGLRGVEAYENHFVLHRPWLPSKNVVVTEESAGRYFGAPVLLRNTDHFSCAKPDGLMHPAHELLVDFWTNDVKRPAGSPDVTMDGFKTESLNLRLEHTRRARMLVMRSNSWFAAREQWLMTRLEDGSLELEVLLPEPSNDTLMTQLRSMFDDGVRKEDLAQSIRTVISRLLRMRSKLPAERKNNLRIATHEYYPPYSAYLFDDNELWYIPYHRKAHALPVFVYSGGLKHQAVYEDFRTLPVWPLTGDEWRGRLGGFARGLFDDVLAAHPEIRKTLQDLEQRGTKVYLFGGFVRDCIHAFVHKEQLPPRDIDLVVDGVTEIGVNGKQNHFGGIRWETGAGLRVDCWDLSSTLAFRKALVSPSTVENLPRTTVYQMNGCYISLGDGALHGDAAIADVYARRVAFNCKSYLTTFPEYQAFRGINFSERLRYELDDEVNEFISQTLRATGVARFVQKVREHRPELEPGFLQDCFARYFRS